jgi:hypothetical protein
MNTGYVYFICPIDINDNINYKLCKIGFFTTNNLEETLRKNYKRSFAKYHIYESIHCINPRKNESIIHSFLHYVRLNDKNEVFDISNIEIRNLITDIKSTILKNEEILKKTIVKNINYPEDKDPIIEIREEDIFSTRYNITPIHLKIFRDLCQKIYKKEIYDKDFQKFIESKKLIYNDDLYDIFKKYLIYLDHGDDKIEEIYLLKKHYKKTQDLQSFVTKADIKKLLKNNNFKITEKELETIIPNVFNCEYKTRKMFNNTLHSRIFIFLSKI